MLCVCRYTEEDITKLFPEADASDDEFMDFNEFKRYINFQDQVDEEEEID